MIWWILLGSVKPVHGCLNPFFDPALDGIDAARKGIIDQRPLGRGKWAKHVILLRHAAGEIDAEAQTGVIHGLHGFAGFHCGGGGEFGHGAFDIG